MGSRDDMRYVLTRVDYWLNYAEAKNAALVGFNFVVIAIVASLAFQESAVISVPCAIAAILLFTVSSVIGLCSFVPSSDGEGTENPYNFFDTAQDGASDWLASALSEDEDDKLLAEEVGCNSRIAVSKYRSFNNALLFTVLGMALMVFCLTTAFFAAL